MCTICRKAFARQDALDRHARLHRRTSTVVASPVDIDPHVCAQQYHNTHDYQGYTEEVIIQPPEPDAAFGPPHLTDTSLFWPDSEGLLQNIISIDPALWEQPITLMPSTIASRNSPDASFDLAMRAIEPYNPSAHSLATP
jgi:hypothetical protein